MRGAAVSLAGTTLTAVETIAFAAGGTNLTVNAADLANVTTLTGAAGSDTLTLADVETGVNLSGKTITSLDTVQLGTGGDFLALDNTAAVGITNIIGGSGSDTIRYTSTTNGQTLTLGAGVTAIENVVITDATGVLGSSG